MKEGTGVLEDYLKKGLEKGFNISYIKDILIKHGHSEESVETAANNILGLKYPEKLKPHLEEEGSVSGRKSNSFVLTAFVIILILFIGFFAFNYFSNRSTMGEVKSQLEEIKDLGVGIDDLSSTIRTQSALLKEKDLTLDEKEKIINDQLKLIDQIDIKIEEQRTKLNDLILDIMNRMIGRMSE